MSFTVGGISWFDETFVQTYASFQPSVELEEPEERTSFTCSAEYNRGQGYAEKAVVKSFVGTVSLRVMDNKDSKWNEIAQQDELLEDQALWTRTEGNEEEDYKSFVEIQW